MGLAGTRGIPRKQGAGVCAEGNSQYTYQLVHGGAGGAHTSCIVRPGIFSLQLFCMLVRTVQCERILIQIMYYTVWILTCLVYYQLVCIQLYLCTISYTGGTHARKAICIICIQYMNMHNLATSYQLMYVMLLLILARVERRQFHSYIAGSLCHGSREKQDLLEVMSVVLNRSSAGK